jgi:Tfp pilus assembly protein PilO
MHDEKTVQRFIELRAQGWIYSRLITELNVSKSTLIHWSRKHQFQIQNLKAIELEALSDKWLASVTDRVNALGAQLRKVEAEIATRDVKDLGTAQLYLLARSLRRQIEQATGSVQFTSPVSEIPVGEYHDQVQDWSG